MVRIIIIHREHLKSTTVCKDVVLQGIWGHGYGCLPSQVVPRPWIGDLAPPAVNTPLPNGVLMLP